MNRKLVGILAVVLLAVSGLLALQTRGALLDQTFAGTLRVGFLLAALWLALPNLMLWQSRAFLGLLACAAIVLALWPKFFLFFAIATVVFLAILRPRWGAPRPKPGSMPIRTIPVASPDDTATTKRR